MLNLIFVCAQLILTAPLVLTQAQDPCNAYSQFPKAEQRFIENKATANLNDRLLRPDWYGVEGFEIPNSGLADASCGTQYPIGVLGHLDTQNTDVQKVEVCAYAGGKCYKKFFIEAKICKKLTIYKTIRSPVSGAAYCLAQKSSKAFPDFKAEPIVRLELDPVDQLRDQYRYYCDFKEHATNKKLKYQSIWLINGFQINRSSKFVDYNDKKGRSLTDDQLLSSNAGVTSVGFKISCGIRASLSDEASAGFPSIAQEIFIGITVLYPKNGIVIREGESGFITIKVTAPIGTKSDKDRLGVLLQTPIKTGTHDLELTTDSGCGINISPKEWNQNYQIKLKTSITQSYDNVHQLMKVKLRTPKEYIPHKIWSDYTVFPLVDVYVTKSTKKIEGSQCGLTSDPRLSTFTRRGYSMQLTGTFILYQNNDYEIEVQVKNFKCNRFEGYCVCGIVVKAGRTAFMINVCDKKNKRIDYVACGDSADVLNVMKNGDFEYKVKLPHKGTVKITIRDIKSPSIEWLNVIIYPSIVDFPDHPRSVHLGLCGGITEEEVTRKNEGVVIERNAFFERWRIKERDSLFNIENLEALQNSVPSITYRTCRCSQENSYELNENINCKVYPDEAESDKKFKHVNINIARCNAPGRKRRSLATFQHEAHEIVKRDVSWRNGWTEEKARLYCQKLFNDSNMIKKCKDVPGVNLSAPLKSCFDDIQLTGTDIFALSALDTVRSKCLYEVEMNVTLQEEQSDKPSVFQVVQDIACLGDCSQRGECKKGICICNPGYIGSDCSVDANERPSAESLDTDGYCDLSRETCDKIAVFGGIFIDSDHFLCKMDKFQVSVSEKLTIKRGISLKGNVESIGEVTCPLPGSNRKRRNAEQVPVIDNSVEGYRIAVSNTGNVYSEWLTMVTFNSQCVSCEIKGDNVNCTFSSDQCYSDNRCYRNGERHRTNRDYVCDSKRQMWIKSVLGKKGMSNDEWTMLGVGVGGAVIVLIIVVVTIICLKQKRCNRKSKHQAATVDVVQSPNDIYESLKRERGTEDDNPYLGLQNMKTKVT